MTRRTMLAAGVCACAARAAGCFCEPQLLAPDALAFGEHSVTIDLARAGTLPAVGGSGLIRDETRKLAILVVHPAQGKYAAFSAKCTHGGSPVSFDSARGHIQCVCYGHSIFATGDGAVVKGPAKTPLPAYTSELAGGKLIIRFGGAS